MHPTVRCAQNPQSLRHPAVGFPPMNKTPIHILRLPQVIDATGLGNTKNYGLQGRRDFPTRIEITAHSVCWVEEEVQAWLAQRVEKGRPESAPESTVIP